MTVKQLKYTVGFDFESVLGKSENFLGLILSHCHLGKLSGLYYSWAMSTFSWSLL